MALDLRSVLVLAAAATLAAPPAALAKGRTYTVPISMLKFGPPPAEAEVGDVIEWVNADIFRHSATAKDKSFDVDLAPKAHGRTVLAKAGVVDFYCRYHPDMTGRITVRAAGER